MRDDPQSAQRYTPCTPAKDLVAAPQHYTYSAYEPLDIIEEWQLPYHLGNVLKYIARYRHKGSELTDLKKARQYLDRYIALLERQSGQPAEEVAL